MTLNRKSLKNFEPLVCFQGMWLLESEHTALPMCHAMFILLCILIVCVYLFIYLLYCPFYLNASFTEWFLYC